MYVYCENNSVNRIDILGECWYDAKGNWRHDNWEYIGNYERKSAPKTKPVVDITWKLTNEMRKNEAVVKLTKDVDNNVLKETVEKLEYKVTEIK